MSHRSRWLAPALSLTLVACVVDPIQAPTPPVESQTVVKLANQATIQGSLPPALQTPSPAPAGQLAGLVLAPPGYTANPGMNMVAAGGMNALAAGSLVAAGGLNYGLLGPRRLLNLIQEVLVGAPVQIFGPDNQPLTEPVLTDASGNYLIPKLPAGAAPFVVKVGVKTGSGAAVVLEALVRPNETLRGDVDLASTMVTAAVLAQSGGKLDGVHARDVKRATSFVVAALDQDALPDLTNTQALADVVLNLAKGSLELRGSLLALAGLAAPATPGPGASGTPTPDPTVSGTPNPTGSGSADPSASPTASAKPTAQPIGTPPPLKGPELFTAVRLAFGTDRAGYVDADVGLAQFQGPKGIAFDGAGKLYVADSGNKALRVIAADGVVSTILGGTTKDADNQEAKWTKPSDVVSDAAGTTCWVADPASRKIWTVSHVNGKTARAVVLAGGTEETFAEGVGTAARFENPAVLASDGQGTLFVADAKESGGTGARILKVDTATGDVKLFAGGSVRGVANGKGLTEAKFQQPAGLAVRFVGTTREVWVSDATAGNVRRIVERVGEEPLVTTVIGPTEPTAESFDARVYGHRDTLPLSAAKFRNPGRLIFSPSGDLFVIDTNNKYVRWVRFQGGEPVEIRTLAPANVATGGGTSPFTVPNISGGGLAIGPTTGTIFVSQPDLARISEIK